MLNFFKPRSSKISFNLVPGKIVNLSIKKDPNVIVTEKLVMLLNQLDQLRKTGGYNSEYLIKDLKEKYDNKVKITVENLFKNLDENSRETLHHEIFKIFTAIINKNHRSPGLMNKYLFINGEFIGVIRYSSSFRNIPPVSIPLEIIEVESSSRPPSPGPSPSLAR